jgi:hypothetical protein
MEIIKEEIKRIKLMDIKNIQPHKKVTVSDAINYGMSVQVS